MAQEVEILRRRDVFSPRPERATKQDRISFYRVGGPAGELRHVVLPLEGWTEAKEEAAIRAAEREVVGRKFTL